MATMVVEKDAPPVLESQLLEFEERSPPYGDVTVYKDSFANGADSDKYLAGAKKIRLHVRIISSSSSSPSPSSSSSKSSRDRNRDSTDSRKDRDRKRRSDKERDKSRSSGKIRSSSSSSSKDRHSSSSSKKSSSSRDSHSRSKSSHSHKSSSSSYSSSKLKENDEEIQRATKSVMESLLRDVENLVQKSKSSSSSRHSTSSSSRDRDKYKERRSSSDNHKKSHKDKETKDKSSRDRRLSSDEINSKKSARPSIPATLSSTKTSTISRQSLPTVPSLKHDIINSSRSSTTDRKILTAKRSLSLKRHSVPIHQRPKAPVEDPSFLFQKQEKLEKQQPDSLVPTFKSFKIPKKKTPESALLCSYTSILKSPVCSLTSLEKEKTEESKKRVQFLNVPDWKYDESRPKKRFVEKKLKAAKRPSKKVVDANSKMKEESDVKEVTDETMPETVVVKDENETVGVKNDKSESETIIQDVIDVPINNNVEVSENIDQNHEDKELMEVIEVSEDAEELKTVPKKEEEINENTINNPNESSSEDSSSESDDSRPPSPFLL